MSRVNGQTLPVAQFEDLYRQLGRASSDDPYGVLAAGAPNRPRRQPRQTPLSYWIFVGQDIERITQVTGH
jgi:hypothetical protein